MWLLDVNIPKGLVHRLDSKGIKSDTATNRGWATLTNGSLVKEALTAGFTAILTKDKNFVSSASRETGNYKRIAIVIINISQYPEPEYLKRFDEHWRQNPIDAEIGEEVFWP